MSSTKFRPIVQASGPRPNTKTVFPGMELSYHYKDKKIVIWLDLCNDDACPPGHIALNPQYGRPPVEHRYGIEGPSEICTQSHEVRLARNGAQPLFTLG